MINVGTQRTKSSRLFDVSCDGCDSESVLHESRYKETVIVILSGNN